MGPHIHSCDVETCDSMCLSAKVSADIVPMDMDGVEEKGRKRKNKGKDKSGKNTEGNHERKGKKNKRKGLRTVEHKQPPATQRKTGCQTHENMKEKTGSVCNKPGHLARDC